jgi:hypothetical protein
LKNGSVDRLIKKAKDTSTFCDIEFNIPKQTRYSRIWCGNLSPSHPGPCSPLIQAEKYFVMVLNGLEEMNMPLFPNESIALINLLIESTDLQKKLIDFQMKNCSITKRNNFGKVSRGYFQNFLERNKDVIESSSPRGIEDCRDKWCNYYNMSLMYNRVYNGMVGAGVAKKLDIPVFYDREGNMLSDDNDEKQHGRKVTHELTHPKKGTVLLFFLSINYSTLCNTIILFLKNKVSCSMKLDVIILKRGIKRLVMRRWWVGEIKEKRKC